MDTAPAAGPEATQTQEATQPKKAWEQRYEISHFDLRNGPCTWHTCKHRGTYRSRQGANKMFRRLEELGIAEAIGEIAVKGEGGISFVWAAKDGQKWKKSQLLHDVIAYWVIVRLNMHFLNGDDVDHERWPDFELYDPDGNRVAFGEVCTGSTSYKRVKEERFEDAYLDCEETVLWITVGLWSAADTTRRDGLMALTDKQNHWFITLQEVLDQGHQAIALNCDGEARALTDLLTVNGSASTQESQQDAENHGELPPDETQERGV